MKIIALNKLNGVAFFTDEKESLKYISFPYTENFIREANNGEVDFAISYFNFDAVELKVDNIQALIKVLKKLHIESSLSNPYNESLNGIDINDIINYADEDNLMKLLDQVEHTLINKNEFKDTDRLINSVLSKSKLENYEKVFKKAIRLNEILIKKERSRFHKYAYLFPETISEIGEDMLFKVCHQAAKKQSLYCFED